MKVRNSGPVIAACMGRRIVHIRRHATRPWLLVQDQSAGSGGRRRPHHGGPVRYLLKDIEAAHSFSPSQDPERAGVIDDLSDHLPAAVRSGRMWSAGTWTGPMWSGDGWSGNTWSSAGWS
jgi:hypothetical protein